MGFHPCVYTQNTQFSQENQIMDENKLAQISIPPLCIDTTDMAHTPVGKAVPLQVEGYGFKPRWGYSVDPGAES